MFLHLVVKSGKRYDTRSVLARRYRGGRGKEGDTLFSTSWERKEKNEKKGERQWQAEQDRADRLVCRQAGRQVCVVIMAAAFLLEMLEAPLGWINHPLKGTQVPNYILPLKIRGCPWPTDSEKGGWGLTLPWTTAGESWNATARDYTWPHRTFLLEIRGSVDD